MKFQKVARLRTQMRAVSAKHAERNEVKRGMTNGNFEFFLRQHRTKPALRALHASCLHIFRHLAQVLLGGRQPAGVDLVQSDEKSDGAICAQALCGVALKKFQNFRTHAPLHCVSLCATAETVHICHSANVYFLKFHAPTLR